MGQHSKRAWSYLHALADKMAEDDADLKQSHFNIFDQCVHEGGSSKGDYEYRPQIKTVIILKKNDYGRTFFLHGIFF